MKWYVYRAPGMGKRSPFNQRLCQVLIEAKGPGPRNLLIEFENGHKIVTIHRKKSVRLARRKELQVGLF